MAQAPSVMKLHLRYRLFIAEMNLDINILRIFDDYVQELQSKINEPDIKKGIGHFEKQFAILRSEIDELKHEMHLLKMKLAAYAREKKGLDIKTYKADNHVNLRKRYKVYRKNFEKLKNEFRRFEGEWLV
jgi:hypothetical protein